MTYSALATPRMATRRTQIAAPTLTVPKLSHLVMYITLACLLGLVYLVQVTQINANGYKLDDYEQKSLVLQKTHDDLALAAARAQNLDIAEDYGVNSGMVAVAPE